MKIFSQPITQNHKVVVHKSTIDWDEILSFQACDSTINKSHSTCLCVCVRSCVCVRVFTLESRNNLFHMLMDYIKHDAAFALFPAFIYMSLCFVVVYGVSHLTAFSCVFCVCALSFWTIFIPAQGGITCFYGIVYNEVFHMVQRCE